MKQTKKENENTMSTDRALDLSISLWQYVVKSQYSNCPRCFLLQTIIGNNVAIIKMQEREMMRTPNLTTVNILNTKTVLLHLCFLPWFSYCQIDCCCYKDYR